MTLWTLTELARKIGVSTNQVWTWHQRRERNGFPEPIGHIIKPVRGGRKKAPFFDVDQVLAWHRDYDPRHSHGKHWHEKRGGSSPISRALKWQERHR